jgi:hypothetical protein
MYFLVVRSDPLKLHDRAGNITSWSFNFMMYHPFIVEISMVVKNSQSNMYIVQSVHQIAWKILKNTEKKI